MFTGLPETPKPWKSVACSFLLQVAGIAALIAIGLLPHQEMVRQAVSSYMPLTAPTLEARQPELQQSLPVVTPKAIQIPPKLVAKLNLPARPPVRELEPVRPPEVKLQSEEFVPVAPKVVRPEAPRVVETGTFTTQTAPVIAKADPKKVETGEFSTGSSATPTSKLPPQKVQTGGFGDPNGVPASNKGGNSQAQIARLGGFDLPQGPGNGNGTGGASGQRGVVASAGFGNGVATTTPGNGGRATQATQPAGFSDSQAAATAPQTVRKAAMKTANVTGVEILHKPAPEYTDEARRLRIEGEVLLDVVFTANGQLQIVKVVRGLGHGLDEAAVRAAERLQFKPATKEGKPVDSKATLHIVFQLA
jgi:TonB family protein